jgi:hypothetical protein
MVRGTDVVQVQRDLAPHAPQFIRIWRASHDRDDLRGCPPKRLGRLGVEPDARTNPVPPDGAPDMFPLGCALEKADKVETKDAQVAYV